jgi:hypothetical protein
METRRGSAAGNRVWRKGKVQVLVVVFFSQRNSAMPLTEQELLERDAKRNIGEELLHAIRDVKAGRYGAVYEIAPNETADALGHHAGRLGFENRVGLSRRFKLTLKTL